jgi:hypothetical protein
MQLEAGYDPIHEQREKNRMKAEKEHQNYKEGKLDKSSAAYKTFRKQERLEKMKLPIYDAFIKKHPESKLLEVGQNVGDRMSKPVLNDYHEAVDKLFKKYPELKSELEKKVYTQESHGHGQRVGSRIFNMVNNLRSAERFAIKEYADHLEDIDEILDEIEEVNDEIAKMPKPSYSSRGRRMHHVNLNTTNKIERLNKKQKKLYEKLYDLDPDNEIFEDTNNIPNNTILNGPLISMKKSNFRNKTEKNLLTMPSREKELENLFKGGKTRRKSRKTRKTKKMFFGLF